MIKKEFLILRKEFYIMNTRIDLYFYQRKNSKKIGIKIYTYITNQLEKGTI